MTEQFNDKGSLYILENQQWKKVGNGHIILMTNIHKPTHILVKIIDKKNSPPTANTGTVFQCKPKTKPKGNKSYILKGLDTKTNNEYIIAARFKHEDTATCFKIAVQSASEAATDKGIQIPVSPLATSNNAAPRTFSPPPPLGASKLSINSKHSLDVVDLEKPHARTNTMSPEQLKASLANSKWDCNLCTTHNKGEEMVCRTCNTPRLMITKQQYSVSVDTEDSPPADQNNNNNKNENNEPQLYRLSTPSDLTVGISAIYGTGDPQGAPSPQPDGSAFDWSSPAANTKLNAQPSPDGGDVDSSKKDFIRILKTIEANMTNQDPLKLFDDLQKVAKRLMRKDAKYRTLDMKNPVVQERLMKIAGVDAYLAYLGYEEAPNHKMVCPDDQPPRSVIQAAQQACDELLSQWKKKQHIFQLLSQSTKNLKKEQSKSRKPSLQPLQENNEDVKTNAAAEHHAPTEEEDAKASIDSDEQYTLRQLVWSITHYTSRDEKQTAEVLLLCHSTFADSADLLSLLVERFHGNTTESGANSELHCDNAGTLTESQINKRWNIQFKVGSMLSSWMKRFWEQDFETKPGLMEDLEAFFESVAASFHEDKRVGVLLKKMMAIYDMQYAKYSEDMERKERMGQKQHKDMASMIGKPNNFSIQDQKAVTIAEQFTLMHFKAFKAITKRECLGQSWKKKDGNAQYILEMIKLFNQTAKWVQILILTQPTLNKRSKVMKLCISAATYMRNFRNFSGACAFHSALSSTPIHRLKIAWSKLSASDIKKFKELKRIFGFGSNWMDLRKLHRQAHAPAILHTGLFLQDLVGIDEGFAGNKNGKVNFKKLLKLKERIDTIAMYQQEEYQFQENLLIQSRIFDDFKAQQHIDDDILFKTSNSVKASDARKK